MLESISKNCAEWLYQSGVIYFREKEVYSYATYCILTTLSPFLISILVGTIMGMLTECIVMTLPFLFERKFAGGYHAKYAWLCTIESNLLVGIALYLTAQCSCNLKLNIVTIMATLSLAVFSPIDSENRRLESEEKKICKIGAITSAAFFDLIFWILQFVGETHYSKYIAMGIILSALLQTPVILGRFIQKMTKNSTKMSSGTKSIENQT